MNDLYLIVLGVLAICFLSFMSWKLVFSQRLKPEAFTPELLERMREKMRGQEYLKWLRQQNTILAAEALECKERGAEVPRSWVQALRLMEDELEKTAREENIDLLVERISDDVDDKVE